MSHHRRRFARGPWLALLGTAGVLTACQVYPMTPTVDVSVRPAAVAIATFTPAATVGGLAAATGSLTPVATLTLKPDTTTPEAVAAVDVPPPTPTLALPSALVQPAVAPPPAATSAPAAPLVDARCSPPCDVAAAEAYTVELINFHRTSAGAPPLARDETLMDIARARVADMVARGYTGHHDPVTGQSLGRSLMRSAGYTSNFLGENWYGSIQGPPGIVETAMAWFMADPPHAGNILSPNYVGVGVGIAFNGRQWLLVQNFAGP